MTAAESFTPLELDFLWESLGAGELPYPFELRSHGATIGERGALRQRTLAELQKRQVLDDTGRVVPHIEDLLLLLAQAESTVDAVYLTEPNSPPLRVLSAAGADRAVLARQDGDGFRIGQVPPTALASSIVDALPPAPRGSEQSISLPADELTSAQRQGFQPLGGGRASEDDTRKALGRLFDQQRLRGGQFAANARNRMGARSRSRVLGWFDTDSGRYLSQTTGSFDGREWITIAPADAPTLRHRVGEMLSGVQAATAVR
ncbi:MAG: ESX secretion-associated protein EspG [Pseudonocardiaceae bacterium]|nr:ESX secretion-associated protein EspG [Pseudonocardiaceae bacterium]